MVGAALNDFQRRSIVATIHTNGAAALAGLIKEREQLRCRCAAVIVSGQNIDRAWLQTVLAGGTPRIYSACKSESATLNPAGETFLPPKPLSVVTYRSFTE